MKNGITPQVVMDAFNQLTQVAKTSALSKQENPHQTLKLEIDQQQGSIVVLNGSKSKVQILISKTICAKNNIEESCCHSISVIFSSIYPGLESGNSYGMAETYSLTLDEDYRHLWLAADGYHFHPLTLIKKIFLWLLYTNSK